jgi:hypothetical protein
LFCDGRGHCQITRLLVSLAAHSRKSLAGYLTRPPIFTKGGALSSSLTVSSVPFLQPSHLDFLKNETDTPAIFAASDSLSIKGNASRSTAGCGFSFRDGAVMQTTSRQSVCRKTHAKSGGRVKNAAERIGYSIS